MKVFLAWVIDDSNESGVRNIGEFESIELAESAIVDSGCDRAEVEVEYRAKKMETVSIALQTWDSEKKEVSTEAVFTFTGNEFDDTWYGKTFNVEKIEKNGDAITGDEFEALLGNRLTDYLDVIRDRFWFAEFDYVHLTSRVVEPYTPCEFVE